MRAQRHGKDIAPFAIEIRQIALRMIDRTDRHIGQARKTVGQEAQSDALPGPRIAVNHRKAALPDLRMLDPPAEVLYPGRHGDRLGRQFRGEGIPLQPLEGQEFLVHTQSLSVDR